MYPEAEGLETTKDTGTVVVTPLATSAIEPVYVPAARVPWVADTVRVAFVLRPAPDGDTLSHVVPALVPVAVAEKVVVAVAVTERACVAGALPLAVASKTREVGLTVSVGGGGDEVSTRDTGMLVVLPLALTVIDPL